MSAIRVSRVIFEEAKREASAMCRSVAGQLEHWARLGQAVEAAGLAPNEVKELLYKRMVADEPLARFVNKHPAMDDVRQAKSARQKMDYQAQKDGLVAPARMSPFAGIRVSARIREVPLDE